MFSLREALKYCRLADDQQNLPYCLRDIGRVYLLTGEIDSTLFYYHRAIDIARMKKALSAESVICKELGVAYKTAGKYREAIEVVKRFSEMNTIIKNPSSCGMTPNAVTKKKGQILIKMGFNKNETNLSDFLDRF